MTFLAYRLVITLLFLLGGGVQLLRCFQAVRLHSRPLIIGTGIGVVLSAGILIWTWLI